MEEWLQSLVPWGTQAIIWVQAHSTPWLDSIARFFTELGYEEFYLFALPLVYWCIDRQIGIGLGFVSMLSGWTNGAIKYLFSIPRPSGPIIQMKAPQPETSPSFPSGHAQNAMANWGYLALSFRKWWLAVAAVVAILGIGLSRIVLGVHYPQDVIGGWLIGLVLLAVYVWVAPPLGRWVGRRSAMVKLVLALGVAALLVFLYPADENGLYPAEGAITAAAGLAGLSIGLIMERAWVRFQVQGVWWRRTLRFLLGMAVVAVFYLGPKQLLPGGLSYAVESLARFLRYLLVAWAVVFLCPWLFVRLRLAGQEA